LLCRSLAQFVFLFLVFFFLALPEDGINTLRHFFLRLGLTQPFFGLKIHWSGENNNGKHGFGKTRQGQAEKKVDESCQRNLEHVNK
jgi:hypothetical protein